MDQSFFNNKPSQIEKVYKSEPQLRSAIKIVRRHEAFTQRKEIELRLIWI